MLFSEDFRGFPIGEFPFDRDHSATGEYHYVTEAGDHGAWADQVLWQLGEPSERTRELGKVSADMPFQVYDIDHDGVDEVIVGWDFEIRILDGRTGQVKRSVRTPIADQDDENLIGAPFNTYAFTRLNPDGIRICNFRGLDQPSVLRGAVQRVQRQLRAGGFLR